MDLNGKIYAVILFIGVVLVGISLLDGIINFLG